MDGDERMKESLIKHAVRRGKSLVYFHLPGCHYCELMRPVVRKSAYTKLFVDANQYPGIVERYGIRSFPTTRLYDNGKLVEEIVGYRKSLAPEKKTSDREKK